MSTTTDLKTVLDATTEALNDHPDAGVKQIVTTSELADACTVSSPLGELVMTFDQPAPVGDDRGPNPGSALLASLGACQAQVYRIWSEKLGIAIDDLRVEVRGELDVRSLFGADGKSRAGFSAVDIDVHIAGPETPERYEELRRTVDEHCPMLDVVANPVPTRTSIRLA